MRLNNIFLVFPVFFFTLYASLCGCQHENVSGKPQYFWCLSSRVLSNAQNYFRKPQYILMIYATEIYISGNFPDIFRLCVRAVVIIGLKYIGHNPKMMWFVCKMEYLNRQNYTSKRNVFAHVSIRHGMCLCCHKQIMLQFFPQVQRIKKTWNSLKEVLEDCKI